MSYREGLLLQPPVQTRPIPAADERVARSNQDSNEYHIVLPGIKLDPRLREYRRLPPILESNSWLCFPPNHPHLMAPEIRSIPFRITHEGKRNFHFNSLGIKGAYDAVLYFPRSEEHLARNIPQEGIAFNVNNVPGPNLADILNNGGGNIDNAGQKLVAKGIPITRMVIQFDWPNLAPKIVPVEIKAAQPLTKAFLAYYVAKLVSEILQFVKEGKIQVPLGLAGNWQVPLTWNLKTMELKDVRLLGLVYYHQLQLWVPILALNLPTFEPFGAPTR